MANSRTRGYVVSREEQDDLDRTALKERQAAPETMPPVSHERLAEEFLSQHPGWQRLEKNCVLAFARWLDLGVK